MQVPTFHRKVVPAVLLLFAVRVVLPGQSPFDPQYAPEAARILESVGVLTDRSLYAVNEEVHFTARTWVEGPAGSETWSRVLYAELVDAAGNQVAAGKFPVDAGYSGGALTIPANSLTGNYFLKCYTRWMRNRGPGNFSYTPLKIINPFRNELSVGGNGDPGAAAPPAVDYRKGLLTCRASSPVYETGTEVRLILESGGVASPRAGPQEMHCCLTVVPLHAIDTLYRPTGMHGYGDPAGYRVDFLPETRGPSIYGSLFTPDEQISPGTVLPVRFTVMGAQPDHLTVFTDASGKFVFTPPVAHGTRELFVTPGPEAGVGAEVRIDMDFDNLPLPWSPGEFRMTEDERETATGIALRMQLRDAFHEEREIPEGSIPPDTLPFYGNPVHRIRLDEFINLPTLEEVFINLVPDVNVIRRRGKKMLQVEGENSSIAVHDPLVMIDFIPVFDQEALLRVDPGRIGRIDVIDQVYVRGSNFHGGVVSIVSRKGDLAGIDLPAGSYFFDFRSFEPPSPAETPVPRWYAEPGGEDDPDREEEPGGEDDPDRERIPDTRNTLLWKEDLVIRSGRKQEISFRAPGHSGDYLAVLRWIAGPGEIHMALTRFTVR